MSFTKKSPKPNNFWLCLLLFWDPRCPPNVPCVSDGPRLNGMGELDVGQSDPGQFDFGQFDFTRLRQKKGKKEK